MSSPASPVDTGCGLTAILYWLAAGFADEQRYKLADVFDASLAGIRCPRAIYFAAEDLLPAPPQRRRRTTDRFLRRCWSSGAGSAELVNESMTVSGERIQVFGMADLVVEGRAARFHPAPPDAWATVARRPHDAHLLEANLVAWLLGFPEHAVCYVNEGSAEVVEHPGLTNEISARWALERFADVVENRRARRFPRCPETGLDEDSTAPCTCRYSRIATGLEGN